jgi:peptidoglycan/LPS O-acetylase OafA/YrhL
MLQPRSPLLEDAPVAPVLTSVTASAKKAQPEFPYLEGLRAVAVIMTIIYHLCLYLQRRNSLSGDPFLADLLNQTERVWVFGITGVPLFFVLSGFLLFLPYARAIINKTPFPSTRKFYIRRALRILPAYWVALALIVLFLAPHYGTSNPLVDVGLHTFMLHSWSTATIESINPPFWTMAIESQYYVLLPLVAGAIFLLMKSAHVRLVWGLAGLLFATPFIYAVFAEVVQRYRSDLSQNLTIFYVFGFLSVFATGGLCSFIYTYLLSRKWPQPKITRLGRWLGGGGLLLLALYVVLSFMKLGLENERGIKYWTLGVPILQFGYGGVLLGAALAFQSWRRVLSLRPIRFIGTISYSLYIWNIPLFVYVVLPLAEKFGGGGLTLLASLVGIFVVIIPVSFISYRFVEKPFYSLRSKQH